MLLKLECVCYCCINYPQTESLNHMYLLIIRHLTWVKLSNWFAIMPGVIHVILIFQWLNWSLTWLITNFGYWLCLYLATHCYKAFLDFLRGGLRKRWASQGAQWWRIRLPMQETQVQSLVLEDPRKKEMATHSSILAWEIPWTEEPGGLQSMGLKESNMT